MPLSFSVWMKGSITSGGASTKSGVRQHKSKSPIVMTLLSTKTRTMLLRPSSSSEGDLPARAFLRNISVSAAVTR